MLAILIFDHRRIGNYSLVVSLLFYFIYLFFGFVCVVIEMKYPSFVPKIQIWHAFGCHKRFSLC